MAFSLALNTLMGIAAIAAAAGTAAHHESAPPAPSNIPEPLASSCRAEAQASYDERRTRSSASVAAQWVAANYGLVAGMDARYLDFQRKGQLEFAESAGQYDFPAENRFRACLYGVRLQMLAGSVPQWHPGEPIPQR